MSNPSPGRTYHTVQLEDGQPWGPLNAKLEIVRSQLSLSQAEKVRGLSRISDDDDREVNTLTVQ